jgi:chromosome segregation ATPase
VELSFTVRRTSSSGDGDDSQQPFRRREPTGVVAAALAVPVRRTSSKDADGVILSNTSASAWMNEGQEAEGVASVLFSPLKSSDPADSLLDDTVDKHLEDVPLECFGGSERASSQPGQEGILSVIPLRNDDLTAGPLSTASNNVAVAEPLASEHGDMALSSSPSYCKPKFPTPSKRNRFFKLQIDPYDEDLQDDEKSEATHFHNRSLLRGSLDPQDVSTASPHGLEDGVVPRVMIKEWSELPQPPVLETRARRQTPKFQLLEEDWTSYDTSSTVSDDSPRKAVAKPSLSDHNRHHRIQSDPNASQDDVQHPAGMRRGSGADQVERRHHHEIGAPKTPAAGLVLSGLRRASHLSVSSPITPGSRSNIPPPETLWERNKTLVNEVRFADQTCVELAMRNQALEQQLELLRQHNDSLAAVSGKEAARLQQRLAQLEADIRLSNDEREDLRRRLGRESISRGNEAFLEARVAELEKRNNEQRAIIVETVQKLRSVTSENASLTSKLEMATSGSAEVSKERVAEVEALNLELTQSTELVMQLMENTRRELEESKSVVEKVSSQHSMLLDRVTELETHCNEHSDAALASAQQLDQVMREKNHMEQTIVALEADVHARDERISELVQRCRDQSSSLSTIEEQLSISDRDKRRLEADLQEVQEKATRMELERRESARFKEQAESEREEVRSHVARLEGEMKTQSEDLERLRQSTLQFENIVKRNAELESSLSASENDKRGLELQVQRMQVRIDDLNTREKVSEAEKLSLQGQLHELEIQTRQLSKEASECSQLRDRVTELESRQDSHLMERMRMETDLAGARLEIERISSEFVNMKAAYESKVTDAEARLAESRSALVSLQAECDSILRRIGAAVTSAFYQVDQQATALENRVSQSSNDIAIRLSNLEKDIHFIKESTDFQVASLKEDGVAGDRELSTLTINSGRTQSLVSAPCPLQVIAVEDILNSTFETRSDKTNDLELMEEARFDLSRIARENDGRMSNAASDVTNDTEQDNASSIEGISHLFASGHEGELSFSASDQHDADADAGDVFSAPTIPKENAASVDCAGTEPSVGNLKMEILHVDHENLSHQLKQLESEKARLEAELKEKVDLLAEATSCLALVRGERDSLQFKLSELSVTSQTSPGHLNTPKDKSQGHTRLYSPFLSPVDPSLGRSSDICLELIASRTRVVDAMSIEWSALRGQLERLRTENDELSKDLRSTSSLLKQRSEIFASELKTQQDRCDSLERELSEMKDASCLTQAKADHLETERICFEQQVNSLQRAKIRLSLEERVQTDSQQRKLITDEREEMRRDLESMNDKYNDSLKRIDELQEKMETLCREKEDVLSELGAMLSRNEELESEHERRAPEASSSQTELYHDTLTLLAQSNERLDALSEVESNLARTESEKLALHRNIEEIQQELETSRRALQDCQVELSQVRAEYDSSLSDQRQRLNDLQCKRHDAEEALEAKALALAEAHAAVQAAEASLADSEKARSALEQMVQDCNERIASLQRERQDGAEALESKDRELAEAHAAVQAAEASLADSEKARSALEQMVQDCSERIASLQRERQDGAEALESKDRELAEAHAAVQAAEASREDAEKGRLVLAQTLQDYNKRIALLDESRRELLDKIDACEEEIKAAKENALHAEGLASHAEGRCVELQSELGRMRTERDDFMAKCVVFEEQLKLEAQVNWDLQSDLKCCRGELESVQSDLEQAMESRDDANSELTARIVEVEELRERVQELTDRLEAERHKLFEVEQNREIGKEELAAVQAQKVKLEGKCHGLRQYVTKLMLKCEEWQDYCSEQAKELEKVQDENEYMKKSILERDQVRR